ncbi:pyridoxal phosphate-dependent aminotransferase [Erysipelothrix sp. HDW6C]|uniref:MalY/PatB family protein n=1 Tax=Erysipelothrix sp. HDW6C TaxID=2714930 RepID=UPI00140B64E1|nr:MalY/PatB family protein [Erysipelothrix sp. HDW6C]QIK68851.1 pyridoxal phosphate-dependent aminotransferase [Erysipelothrix sp. HDW6C]
MYDFKTVINRTEQGSAKWRGMMSAKKDIDPSVMPLSVADTDFVMAPEIVKGLQSYLETMVLGYTLLTPSYYEAVIGWFKRRHNWDVKQEWIVESPGVVTALFNAVGAFTEENDGVVIMQPVYYPFKMSIENQKRRAVETNLIVEEGIYRIDYNDLDLKTQDPSVKMLILCSPHNPVGRVWLREELLAVHEICVRNNVLVVSDEIHFDLIMPGHQHVVFSTLNESAAQNTIVATAPSKTFNLAGLQTSNLVIANPVIRKQYRDYVSLQGFHALNALGPKACEIAYNECEGWLDEFVGLIDTNRRLFKSFIETNIPEIIVYPLEGTYLQWFNCEGLGMSDSELNRFMVENCQLFLDAGNMFGSQGEQFQRINIACPTDKLQEALERLYAGVKER